MNAVWVWGVLGAALIVVEIMAPGFFLIFPALGALAVAGLSLIMPSSVEGQIAAFAIVTGLLLALCFRLYRRMTAGGPPVLVNSPDRLVGASAQVEDPITGGTGKIRLGDTVWLARGPDLPRGAAVTVTKVEGTVLEVTPRS